MESRTNPKGRVTTTELADFDKAAELALAEIEETPSVESDPAESAGEEEAQDESGQAESSNDEQPESQEQEAQETEEDTSEEEESIFTDLEEEDDEEASDGPVSLEDLSEDTEIDLGPGHEPKTLKELKESGLRLDDYTRKTQEVSEQRKANEKAVKLWDALQNSPQAVVKQLAVEAGYLDEDANPVKAVDFAPLQTAEEREAEIEKLVEERVEEHPAVKEARQQQAYQTIANEFDRIEKELDTELNEASRQDILNEAKRRDVADLELVTQSMLAKRQRKQAKNDDLKGSAPSKSSGRTSVEGNTEPAGSYEEAVERALVEHGINSA